MFGALKPAIQRGKHDREGDALQETDVYPKFEHVFGLVLQMNNSDSAGHTCPCCTEQVCPICSSLDVRMAVLTSNGIAR
jgi:hypothetical protein